MGLDMYLYLKKTEYKGSFMTDPKDTDLTLDYPIGTEKITEMIEKMGISKSVSRDTLYKVGYWRKANAIHRWFVENCADGEDDCRPVECSIEQLESLLANCKLVKKLPEMAERVLPTQEGFFFGGTEYGEDYFHDIDNTIEIIKAVIKFMKDVTAREENDWTVVYQASW